jgi:hypothetical protein
MSLRSSHAPRWVAVKRWGCARKAVLCPNGAEHASPGQSEAGVPANVAPGTPDPEHVSPERAKQNSLGVCSALSGLCSFVDSQPGASLAAHAASLCPRLICSAPSGQCPSLHVNRRDFRKIRSRALPPDEPSLPPDAVHPTVQLVVSAHLQVAFEDHPVMAGQTSPLFSGPSPAPLLFHFRKRYFESCLVKRSRALLASNATRDSQIRAGKNSC